VHTVTSLQCRLAALQLGHYPKQVLDYIENELAGASTDEINRRVTLEYVVEATKEAIKAMRRKTAPPPVVKSRPHVPGQSSELRHRIVTSSPRLPAKEVRARTRQLAIQMELCFPSTGARK
jgi:hypothetical protein